MKAAIYARVSTTEQAESGTSLENQVNTCIEKAKELGFDEKSIDIYKDKESGTILNRVDLTKLRENLSLGMYSAVIVHNPDRLARKLAYQLLITEEIKKADAKLHFITTKIGDNPEQNLLFQVQGVISEYERAKIHDRTVTGKNNKLKQGVMMPIFTPLGYDFDEENKTLVINEKEAEIVRLIFDLYAHKNYTMRQILDELNRIGAKTKKGYSWNSPSSLYRHLKNEIYIGNFYYNKTKRKVTEGKKVYYEENPKEKWIKISVPPIISKETFEKANSKRRRNLELSKRKSKTNRLFRNLLYCPLCGRKMFCYKPDKNRTDQYVCQKQLRKVGYDTKCKNKRVNAEKIDEIGWEKIKEIISDPSLIIKEMKTNSGESSSIKMIEAAQKDLEAAEQQKSKILHLFKQDLISTEDVENELKDINNRVEKLNNRIKELQRRSEIEENQKKKEQNLIEKAYKVSEIIKKDELTFEEKRNIVEEICEYALLHYEGKGKVNMEIVVNMA